MVELEGETVIRTEIVAAEPAEVPVLALTADKLATSRQIARIQPFPEPSNSSSQSNNVKESTEAPRNCHRNNRHSSSQSVSLLGKSSTNTCSSREGKNGPRVHQQQPRPL